MNADLRRDATPRGSGFDPTTSLSACMPTCGGTPLHVGRASARRRRRRHECRPTSGTPLHVGRVSTRRVFVPVGMNADLRAGRHPTWVGLQPDDVAVGMHANLRRDATLRGSGFNPTGVRARRHECRPTGETPPHVGRVSTRRRRRRHECRPTAGRHSAWVGFQPDAVAVGMNADLRRDATLRGSGFNPTGVRARRSKAASACRHACRPTVPGSSA
jgi:hypothetical protein